MELLAALFRAVDDSAANRIAVHLLINVPGFAPVTQTIHLLSIAAVMGSIVLIDLRVLGLALRSQRPAEMFRRLLPWTWGALVFLALTGLTFIAARPARYLFNPVFGLKLAMLAPVIALTFVRHRTAERTFAGWQESRGVRFWPVLAAAVSLTLWMGVAMAGRWIAYADYLFPPEY